MVDSGSCENIVSTETVSKLGISTKPHPKPYKLAWSKKGGEVQVDKHARITFSIGTVYRDEVWCDVVTMNACHLLLGRLWQYERCVIHDGRANTYSFMFKGVKVVLAPNKVTPKANPKSSNANTSLLSRAKFEEEIRGSEVLFVLIRREVHEQREVHGRATDLVHEF